MPLGYGVHLLDREKCCGVALIANGMSDQARRQARINMESIRRSVKELDRPVIAASSTCTFTMRDEYPHVLGVDNADVRDRIDLATRFIYKLVDSGAVRLLFPGRRVAARRLPYPPPHGATRVGVLFDLALCG